jgi:hypothetical protein
MKEIEKNMEMMKHYHIQETIATVAPIIFNQMDLAGFNLGEENEKSSIKDGAFIVEALRSMMCKYYDIYHPFQQIAESVFTAETEDLSVLKIAESINLKLQQTETD